MSLDKAIEHKKEYRKPYTGAKAIDKTCRNHGSDDWCRENRTFDEIKNKQKAKQELRAWRNEDD